MKLQSFLMDVVIFAKQAIYSKDPVVYKKEWEQQLVSYFTKNLH